MLRLAPTWDLLRDDPRFQALLKEYPAEVRLRLGFSGATNRAYASLFYDGPADTWLAGFDTGATVHYTGQYEDDNIK